MKTPLLYILLPAATLLGYALSMCVEASLPSAEELLLFFIVFVLAIIQLVYLFSFIKKKRTWRIAFLPALFLCFIMMGKQIATYHFDWQLKQNKRNAKDIQVYIQLFKNAHNKVPNSLEELEIWIKKPLPVWTSGTKQGDFMYLVYYTRYFELSFEDYQHSEIHVYHDATRSWEIKPMEWAFN